MPPWLVRDVLCLYFNQATVINQAFQTIWMVQYSMSSHPTWSPATYVGKSDQLAHTIPYLAADLNFPYHLNTKGKMIFQVSWSPNLYLELTPLVNWQPDGHWRNCYPYMRENWPSLEHSSKSLILKLKEGQISPRTLKAGFILSVNCCE